MICQRIACLGSMSSRPPASTSVQVHAAKKHKPQSSKVRKKKVQNRGPSALQQYSSMKDGSPYWGVNMPEPSLDSLLKMLPQNSMREAAKSMFDLRVPDFSTEFEESDMTRG
jgi:hypothetical protein